jgi:signal transduction histidine kinase
MTVSATGTSPVAQRLASMLGLATAYVLLARLGLSLASVERSVTLVWPPTGLALAVLFLFGRNLWPGVAAGALLANALTPGVPVPTAIGIALGNTAEAILGAWLLDRAGFDPALRRPREVIKLVVLAASVSTAVSAAVGSTALMLGGVIQGTTQLANAMRVWWLGDMMGDLIVAPLLLVWLSPQGRLRERGAWLEGAVLLLLLSLIVGMSAVVFHQPASFVFGAQPYAIFPLLIWAALRFGPRGSVTANFAISAVSIWATVTAAGPFGSPSLTDSLLLLQTFVATVALTSMVLGATAAARADAMRAREDFISIASHELRTPLTALQLQIQRLRRMTRPGAGASPSVEDMGTAADVAARQVARMTDLTEVLLDLARLRAGDLQLAREPTDLVSLVRESADAVEGALARKAVPPSSPTFELRTGAPIVGDWDRTRLRQVLENLLGNATKYGGSHTVVVTARATERTATVEIEDHGPGIAEADQERIFQRFQRAAAGSSNAPPGFGLGLHIGREIVEAHGGSLRVSSRPGAGTTFVISLPRYPLRKRPLLGA